MSRLFTTWAVLIFSQMCVLMDELSYLHHDNTGPTIPVAWGSGSILITPSFSWTAFYLPNYECLLNAWTGKSWLSSLKCVSWTCYRNAEYYHYCTIWDVPATFPSQILLVPSQLIQMIESYGWQQICISHIRYYFFPYWEQNATICIHNCCTPINMLQISVLW